MGRNAEPVAAAAPALEDWARRAAAGDERAWMHVAQALAPQWHTVALRMLGDAERAAEVTAEVSVRVYRALPTFRFQASVRTWSYRILLNVVTEARRAHGREQRTVPMEAALAVPAREPVDPVLRIALERVVRELPPELREVITLRYDAGMRFAEIADVLDIPIGTVSTRLRRALAQLAQRLDPPNPASNEPPR